MTMFLLELLSEEIPARLQAGARNRLLGILKQELDGHGIEAKGFAAYSTPRRLTFLVDRMAERSAGRTTERRGPKTSAPPRAIDGFLRATGKSRDGLEIRLHKGEEYYFSVTTSAGRETVSVLPDIIGKTLNTFTWPKSMRWGHGSDPWVRPLRSILCLYASDGEASCIPVDYAGIQSGAMTFGHRILDPDPITISSPDEYQETLRSHKVIVDQDERRQIILDDALATVSGNGLELIADDELLDEITGLVEWPGVLIGPIDPDHLDLPPAVIRSAMRTHQRYLAATKPNSRRISHFLAVANRKPDTESVILAGNQRVLNARLADAAFLLDDDLANSRNREELEEFNSRLGRMIYHQQAGTQLQRAKRIECLAKSLAEAFGANEDDVAEAARYAKTDLVSGTVTEFPDLQGVIGGYLVREAGMSEHMSAAIAEHYQPTGQEDPLPGNPLARIIGISDRINHLTGMFGIGVKVSGSRDPLALRRAAIGLVRILLDSGIDIDLAGLIADAREAYARQQITLTAISNGDTKRFDAALLSFLGDRFLTCVIADGAKPSIAKACLAASPANLTQAGRHIDAVAAFMAGDRAEDLLHVHRRAGRMVGTHSGDDVRTDLLTEPHETDLWRQIERIQLISETRPVSDRMQDRERLMTAEKITTLLEGMADLRPEIDAFFDNVLVNAEDDDLRRNRRAILTTILKIPASIADITLIAGDD